MNVEDFYRDRPDRQRSPEIDYGVHWTEDIGERRWPLWRVTYVEYTGEVVAVRSNDGELRIIGFAPTRADCERMLDGWAEDPVKPLPWAVARLQQWSTGNAGSS